MTETRLSGIAEAIAAFAAGEMLVVVDDEDRENEGDLFVAASHCTPAQMAFIVRHTSGIVCAPLTGAIAKRLRLDPMVSLNDALQGTAFTVSVDARKGLTTGISAIERTATVKLLADATAAPADLVRPGHVFPLIANEGGVLMRSGHTEACVDLCVLAGLPPVGVLAELVNDDGTVMRGPEVAAFAQAHRLKLISIADLIAWRQTREQLVRRLASFDLASEIGPLRGHVYATPFDRVQHFAFVYGELGEGQEVPTRLHRGSVFTDVFGGATAIKGSLARFAAAGRGVLVYLRDGAAGVPNALPEESGNAETRRKEQWREIGLGAQILRDLGVTSIVNLTANPDREFVGLSGFGVTIVRSEGLGD